MVQITAYGKQIKKRLVDLDQSQSWLIEEVKERTGMFFDSGYLHKIMTGERKAQTVVSAINEILELPRKEETA